MVKFQMDYHLDNQYNEIIYLRTYIAPSLSGPILKIWAYAFFLYAFKNANHMWEDGMDDGARNEAFLLQYNRWRKLGIDGMGCFISLLPNQASNIKINMS